MYKEFIRYIAVNVLGTSTPEMSQGAVYSTAENRPKFKFSDLHMLAIIL